MEGVRLEFDRKNGWKAELARMGGYALPTSRMSLEGFARQMQTE